MIATAHRQPGRIQKICRRFPEGTKGIMARINSIAMAILFSCLLANSAWGQNAGALSGTVEDAAGEYVVGAHARLRNQITGQELFTSSEEEGQFRFEHVAFGDYLLIVNVEGFKSAEVVVTVGERKESPIRVPLQIAASAESMTVTADSTSIPTAGQNVDAVQLDRNWLENLPTKEGDPLAVPAIFLDPAAAGALGPKIIVDGVESSALEVPLTSIRRIYVNKSPYSAEFGRPGRGRIEVVTRKGSRRDYHGNLTFLLRNSALDARNAFTRVRPPLQREIVETELDGPLAKKVRFLLAARYYTSDESATVHARTPAGLVIENVPTPEHNTRLFGRFDFDLTPKHTLTLSYKFKNNSQQNQGVGGFNLAERATDFSIHENEVKVFERAFISPAFLNELHFAFKDEPQQTTSLSDQPAIIVLGAFSSGGAQIGLRQREKAFTIQEGATLIKGKHALRFGGGARLRSFQTTDVSNIGGTFTFASLTTYSSGQPETFTMNQGIPGLSFSQREYYSFFQDETQLQQNLSLSLGLRYEWQSNLSDYHNFAPRIAFAYAPYSGQTVIRGGFGIFYDRQPEIMQQQALLHDGAQGQQIVVENPGYPIPYDPASPPSPSLLRIAPNIRTPYLTQASLGVEHKLGTGRNSLAIDYTTVRGIKLYRTRNINAPLPESGALPDPTFLNIDQFESSGRSRSQSLTVSLKTTLKNRFDLLAQYTFSKSMDDTSGMFSLPANNYALGPEYGRSDYDQRHRFHLIGTYRLPWRLRAGTIVSLNSGIPYNITTGFDDNGDTVPNDRPPGIGRNTGGGPGYASVDFHLSKRIGFARGEGKSSGARPAARVVGDRIWNNGEEGPGPLGCTPGGGCVNQPSVRTFVPWLEVGLDAFNLLNRVNVKNFVGIESSPFFGRANTANPARQLQFSMKLHF
jgi:Carboxypeptidase regulatory-like domain/TonB dependent receptor